MHVPTTNGSAHGLLRSASTSTCGLGHRAGPIVRRCVPLGAEGLPELLLSQSGAHAASGGLRPAHARYSSLVPAQPFLIAVTKLPVISELGHSLEPEALRASPNSPA